MREKNYDWKKKQKKPKTKRYMGNNWCYYKIAIVRGKTLSIYDTYVKILVYLYTTDKQINLFAIGYIVNPSLSVNKVFIKQVEKYLRVTFHEIIIENIRYNMRNKDRCVIALKMFYESK